MVIMFFSSHPLSHYFVALLCRVRVKYFFLGKSDFRKLGGVIGRIGSMIPTIGTKLDLSKLSTLSRRQRAFLFGSGAIVSNILLSLLLFISFLLDFSLIALIFGLVLLLMTLYTEFAYGTRAGDLDKMRREYSI